ncbi:MAG: hypothetical protein RRC34_00095, partial [Lentisphaeria bacterium]|nr:hypothetical protein [Lentisphaeria bacterium]
LPQVPHLKGISKATKMKNTIKNGFSACMGLCDAGWYGGVLVLDGAVSANLPNVFSTVGVKDMSGFSPAMLD